VILLSGGALADDALRERLERAATNSGAMLYVPSGGIGGLDALKAARIAGVERVTISVSKPPAAWRGIAYVVERGFDLEALSGPLVLYDGPVRAGAKHFPSNVNIAAVLAMAGIGYDRTRLKAIADPALIYNTHSIDIHAKTGNIAMKFENVPSPENPKTAWLACYSALAALCQSRSPIRYGT
jgi:aspartate dehydrogenase